MINLIPIEHEEYFHDDFKPNLIINLVNEIILEIENLKRRVTNLENRINNSEDMIFSVQNSLGTLVLDVDGLKSSVADLQILLKK